jgi:PKD repeat protein
MYKIQSVFFLLILHFNSYSQNFEWLKTIGFSKTQHFVASVIAEPNGSCSFLSNLSCGLTASDTIHFDNIEFIIPAKVNYYQNYLVKQDSAGNIIAAAAIGTFKYASMVKDLNSNYYILGQLDTVNTKVGPLTMDSANGGLVFAKFDKDLKFVWAKQYGNSNANPKNLAYTEGHLYFIGEVAGRSKFGDSTYNFSPNIWTQLFGEFNPIDGSIKWSNYFYKPSALNELSLSGLVYLNKKIYFTGGISDSKVVLGIDTFIGQAALIIETDTLGRYKKGFCVKNRKINVVDIVTDGEFLYFCGQFSDTLTWGNKQILTQFKTGTTSIKNSKRELFIASITPSFQPRWFYRPILLDTSKVLDLNYLNNLVHSGGYIYCGGQFSSKIAINGNSLEPKGSKNPDILLFKCDFVGNILWVTSGFCQAGSANFMAAITNQSVFTGGWFMDKMELGKYQRTSIGINDAWLTKITDYSITRGKVSSGPYCAGDTIKIPYKKLGDFDTTNVFIAQLSDENGNFESDYRELGRLKTNKDGTIMGKLPLFNVSSSLNYRIRILSTKPSVQSYYLRDTLRLLIYSRDKANPGPPETICMGDSIKLNTYGGTKWTWSPKYRMDDSTKRQPWAWPIRDTIYKIIIADSSGCGKPDTAFKTIKVRAYPKARLVFADTIICDNDNLKVPLLFEGGDSNYTWRWYFLASSKLWFPSNSGNGKFADTFSFSPTVSKVAIILKDGCTAKADTAYLTISQRKPVSITASYDDTTLCVGNLLNYKATATGGIPKQYRYQWKDLVTNSILSTTDSLKILTKKALKIQLIVNDGCEALGDTALFEVKVKAELKALTNLRDTTICDGKSLNYTAQAVGGDSKTYSYRWVLNGKEISTSNFLNLTSNFLNLTSNLSLITTDNCSPSDTVKKTITVLPSPKADFTWDLACSRTVTKFQFTGTKPSSPITTSFHWNFNNEATSTLENPSHQFAKSGTSTLTLTSSNGCTDTLNKKIEIKVQAKAEFEVKDVCENQTALFINQSQDATGYLWKFGDGQTSQQENPKHNYTISTTTTYNVTLVAQVAGGCADSISKALTINENPSSDFSYTYNGSKVDLKIAKSGNSYQWKFGTTDSLKTIATIYTHTIKSSDQHTVCLTATDLSGCASQTCKNVTVGILKLSEKSFKIFPNPNNGSFTIELDNPETNAIIEIFDLLGSLVKKVERVEKVTLVDLDVASGIYLVKVKNGGVVGMKKVSLVR